MNQVTIPTISCAVDANVPQSKKRKISTGTDEEHKVCDSLLSLHFNQRDNAYEKSQFCIKVGKQKLKEELDLFKLNIQPKNFSKKSIQTDVLILIEQFKISADRVVPIINQTFQKMEDIRKKFDIKCKDKMELEKSIITNKMHLYNQLSQMNKDLQQYTKSIREIEEKKSTVEDNYKKLQCQLNEDLTTKTVEKDRQVDLVNKNQSK